MWWKCAFLHEYLPHDVQRMFLWSTMRNKILGVFAISYKMYYNGVMMSAMVSQITDVAIVCSTICSGANQRKYQRFASLAFVRGFRWPVVCLTKGQWRRKCFHLMTSSCTSNKQLAHPQRRDIECVLWAQGMYVSIKKTPSYTGIGIPIINIRRSDRRLNPKRAGTELSRFN